MSKPLQTKVFNIDDLSSNLASEYSITKIDANRIIRHLFGTISDQVKAGVKVKIVNFGTFIYHTQKPYSKKFYASSISLPDGDQVLDVPSYSQIKYLPSENNKQLID